MVPEEEGEPRPRGRRPTRERTERRGEEEEEAEETMPRMKRRKRGKMETVGALAEEVEGGRRFK